MSNLLYFPDLNPIKLVNIAPTELSQYLTRHLEDYRHHQQIQPWEAQVRYFQKYQTSDATPLQFTSNIDPIQVELIRYLDATRTITPVALVANVIRTNPHLVGTKVYEVTLSFVGQPEGIYFVRATAGSPATITMISEPIHLKTTHSGTIRIDYKNTRHHGDVLFETGISPFVIRVEGSIGRLKPGSSEEVYEDQRLNPTITSSRTFRSFPLHIGGARGIPDWMVDKMNLSWSCNDVKVDGKSFAKTAETKFEFTEEDNYPMRGLTMDLREGINRGSKIFSGDVDPSMKLVVTHLTEAKVFGDISAQGASNLVTVIDVE